MLVGTRARGRRLASVALALAVAVIASLVALALVAGSRPAAAAPGDPVGQHWATRTSSLDAAWSSVAFGNAVFVAVASDGSGVMTSPDGVVWTTRQPAAANAWTSVAFGNGLFVAVASSGSGNRVMTSPDGITWTARTSAADNAWTSVAFGANRFVAVAGSGSGNRVMTSADGITWTARTSAADNPWTSVAFGNNTFVAVAGSGAGTQAMTSPDGTTWTVRTTPNLGKALNAVAYGSSKFVAVGQGVSMTSPDGTTWTNTTGAGAPASNTWTSLTFGNALFVAVADTTGTGSGKRIMTSPDGASWTARTSPAENSWTSVAFGRGMFVAVARSGTGTRVMSSNSLFLTQDRSTLKVVPATGTTPAVYRILYNTPARVAGGKSWGVWGYNWSGAPAAQALGAGNTFDIDLGTYAAAGSCATVPTRGGTMPAKDCQRPLGVLAPGQSMVFRVRVALTVNGALFDTPDVTIARPPDTSAPTAPTQLAATVAADTVQLSWQPATDDVGVTGYRVLRDGTQIASVTGTSHTDTGLIAGASYTYTIVATDAAANASAPSAPATIIAAGSPSAPNRAPVFADASGSYPVSADAAVGAAVTTAVAADADGNALTYSLNGGDGRFAVAPTTGAITVAGALTAGETHMLTVTASDGTASATAQIAVVVNAPGTSGITRQVWTGITGSTVADLTKIAAYPASPTTTEVLAGFPAPTNAADNYGQRVIGYLVPPTTGDYTLSIKSDDGGQLWLNPTGVYPSGSVLLASSTYTTGYVNAPVQRLTAGKMYLLTVLHKEGTGGDDLTVGWTGPGIATRVSIGAQYLLPYRSSVPMTSPSLSASTQRSRVDLTWTAAETSAASVAYRVFRDGTQVAETTSLAYSDTGLATGVARTYRVQAIGSDGRTTASADVSATPVNHAPVMLGAGGHYVASTDAVAGTSLGQVRATDSDRNDTLTYRLVRGDGLAVDAATGALSLTGTPSASGGTRRTFEVAAGDGAVERLSEFTLVLSPPAKLGQAGITRQVWTSIGGTTVADLTSDARFPLTPDATSVLPTTQAPINTGDSYGARIIGYLTPPQTGDYSFWVASDDASELRVSRTTDPADASGVIASVPTYTTATQWTKFASQHSAPMTLVQGQRYLVELLHKEGSGADLATIAWDGPGITGPQVIGSAQLLPYDAVDSVAPTAPGMFSLAAVDQAGVTLMWTAATDANGIAAYRLYRGQALVATLGADALEHTDTGATGTVEYHLEAVDTFGNVGQRRTLSVDTSQAFNALEQAVATGDSSQLVSSASIIDAAQDAIATTSADAAAARAALFNLNADGTAKADGSSLTSITWHPTYDSTLMKSYFPGNFPVLNTNAVFDAAYTVKDRELGIAGTRNGAKFLALGANPFRTAARGSPINEQMHQFMVNSMGWLTGRSDLATTPFKVVIAQLDQSYYFPDETATRSWLSSRFPGQVTYNAADACDGAALAGCLDADAKMLIISQAGNADPAVVAAAVSAAMSRGIPVMYLHLDGYMTGIGTALFDLFDIDFDLDNYWQRLQLSAFDTRTTPAVPARTESVRTLLGKLETKSWSANIAGCSGNGCSDAALASEFYAGARDYMQARLRTLDSRGVDMFGRGGFYRLDKLLVLLGDTLRRDIAYPLLPSKVDAWLRAYFADHAVYNTRSTNRAQPDLGSFSKTLRADLPVYTEDVSVKSRESDHFTAAGLYALPGRAFTVTRTDSGSNQIWLAVNSLRSGSTHEFDVGGFDRPKYLSTPWIELKAGQSLQLSSPYGGPVQVKVKGTGVGVAQQTAVLRFAGVGKHPVWKGASTTAAFTAALASGDYDWAEYITDGFQIHSKVDRLRETLASPRHNTPEALADVTFKYFYQSIFNLAGFTGDGLSVNSKVAALCATNGWDCTDPTVHGMFTVTHFNADRATCGYGCSGNPYDAYWAFDPLGWGDAHEVGHNLQRARMHIEGATTEVSNNIFPTHNAYSWNKDHPQDPVQITSRSSSVFTMLSDAQRTADPKATVRQALWVNGHVFERLEFYRQLAWQAHYLPQFGDGGWDIMTGLYLADRIYGKALTNDTTWAAKKDSLGFSTYTRAMANSVSSNDWMLLMTSHLTGKDQRPVFDMWGVPYSTSASAQLDARALPAAEKRFYVMPKDANGNYLAGYDPVGSVLVDGTTTLP